MKTYKIHLKEQTKTYNRHSFDWKKPIKLLREIGEVFPYSLFEKTEDNFLIDLYESGEPYFNRDFYQHLSSELLNKAEGKKSEGLLNEKVIDFFLSLPPVLNPRVRVTFTLEILTEPKNDILKFFDRTLKDYTSFILE